MNGRAGIHFAAANGQLSTCKLLVAHGVDADAEDSVARAPLHYAALAGHDAVVSLCLLD